MPCAKRLERALFHSLEIFSAILHENDVCTLSQCNMSHLSLQGFFVFDFSLGSVFLASSQHEEVISPSEGSSAGGRPQSAALSAHGTTKRQHRVPRGSQQAPETGVPSL